MGTRKAGERPVPYTVYVDRGIAHLNTRVAGKRHRPSLHIPFDLESSSASERRVVEEAAARAYADLVAGRVLDLSTASRVLTSETLEELIALWLDEAERMWPRGWKTRRTQIGNVVVWASSAKRFERDKRTPLERVVDDAGPAQYASDRLAEVLRDTITKEVSNLFAFFTWALRERKIAAIPKRDDLLPRGAKGVRSGPQRDEPVDVTDQEALDIIAHTPEYAVKGGRGIRPGKPLPPKAFPVRDVLQLSWELALRPIDTQQLSVPKHWAPGQSYVRFVDDKTDSDMRIPCTKVALEILERHAPEGGGVIFGRHDFRNHIEKAAAAVLPPEKAEKFARYDFRHGRLNHALEVTGDLKAVAGLGRHARMTTTNRYVRSTYRDVQRLIAALDAAAPVSERSATLTGDSTEAPRCGTQLSGIVTGVRRRGLEPLRCYPLAPQGSLHLQNCVFLDDLEPCSTSENATKRQGDDTGWSASGQHAVLRARQGLAVERFGWSAFDMFTLSALGVVEHGGVQ